MTICVDAMYAEQAARANRREGTSVNSRMPFAQSVLDLVRLSQGIPSMIFYCPSPVMRNLLRRVYASPSRVSQKTLLNRRSSSGPGSVPNAQVNNSVLHQEYKRLNWGAQR